MDQWIYSINFKLLCCLVHKLMCLRHLFACLQGGRQYLVSLLQLSSKNTRLFLPTLMTGKPFTSHQCWGRGGLHKTTNNGFIVCCNVKLWCDGCSTRCHHWGQEIPHLGLLHGVSELYDRLILSHVQDFFSPPTLYFLRTSNKIIQGKLMNDVEPMETWHQRHQYNFHFRAMKFALMSKYL